VKTNERCPPLTGEAQSREEITKHFSRAHTEDVRAILETLVVMGQARRGKEKGRYVG